MSKVELEKSKQSLNICSTYNIRFSHRFSDCRFANVLKLILYISSCECRQERNIARFTLHAIWKMNSTLRKLIEVSILLAIEMSKFGCNIYFDKYQVLSRTFSSYTLSQSCYSCVLWSTEIPLCLMNISHMEKIF